MRRTLGLETLASRADRPRVATHSTVNPRDQARSRATDAASSSFPLWEGRMLDNRRVTQTAGCPGSVSRRERWRAEQT
jgi:hypothetical protein